MSWEKEILSHENPLQLDWLPFPAADSIDAIVMPSSPRGGFAGGICSNVEGKSGAARVRKGVFVRKTAGSQRRDLI